MYFYIQGDSREKAMGGLRNENGAHPINIYTQHMPPIDTITLVHKSATEAQENRDLEKSSRQRASEGGSAEPKRQVPAVGRY